jgi:hypothetical protein
LVRNVEVTDKYFLDLSSFSLVFKDSIAEKNIIDLVKKLGININLTLNNNEYAIRNILYKNFSMRLNYFFSVEKNL